MKKYLILLFLFPFLVFGVANPAVHTIQHIDSDVYYKYLITLEDGSIWESLHDRWSEGDQVVITFDDSGFLAKKIGVRGIEFVGLVTAPATYVTEIEDAYFVLSDGLILESKPSMTLDVGDHIFLCAHYSFNSRGYRLTEEVVVYNVSKHRVEGLTNIVVDNDRN